MAFTVKKSGGSRGGKKRRLGGRCGGGHLSSLKGPFGSHRHKGADSSTTTWPAVVVSPCFLEVIDIFSIFLFQIYFISLLCPLTTVCHTLSQFMSLIRSSKAPFYGSKGVTIGTMENLFLYDIIIINILYKIIFSYI